MNVQRSNWAPAVFLGPAVFLLFMLMVYPALETIRLSFMDRLGERYIGLANYDYALTSPRMQEAFRNNLLWLVVFTSGTVGLGLLIATLADRVRYESLAKAIIFMPMAISFVGAGVIWKFVYDLRAPGTPLQPNNQIGVLNAVLLSIRPDGTLSDAIAMLNTEGVPITDEEVMQAIIEVETARIEEAVDGEDLTRAEADELLDILPGRVREYLDGQTPPRDERWQALGQWPRAAIAAINEAIATLPPGSGRIVCNAIPHACAMQIESIEGRAIDEAVAAGTLSAERARELRDSLRAVSVEYVRSGTRPAGEGWQTLDQWDDIIAGVNEVNIRAVNTTLDTGLEPIDWIRRQGINNFALIIVGVWIWTGFCMVVLSAALKGIPAELIEAARVDGANEFQVFFKVIIPMLMPTLTVVTTTMFITVLKVFDIVYVMTAGNFGTEVIANRMYLEMYGGNREFGHASAIAVILMLAIVPIMIYNIIQFRRQEARR